MDDNADNPVGCRCPGESRCPIINPNLDEDRDEDDAETAEDFDPNAEDLEPEDPREVCPNCPLYPTKPGTESPFITTALSLATAHEARLERGQPARVLTPALDAILEGLRIGRARWREESDRRFRRKYKR